MLNLDPEPQLLASILAKKVAVGSKYVLIDIPYGKGAKVSKPAALALKKKFLTLGESLDLKIRVVLTDGSQPIGNGIGPILEVKDVLRVLKRENSPLDLEKKSVFLAGNILELTGNAPKGKGIQKARKILDSGQAFNKFKEIIKAQEGSIDNLPEAKYNTNLKISRSGRIVEIKNKETNRLARILGCPNEKTAGVYLYKHLREKVKKGENILTLYSESRDRLKEAISYAKSNNLIVVR